MKREAYNEWRRKANKQPEDWVDLDDEWDEKDAQCTQCWLNEPHTWLEHDRSIDSLTEGLGRKK